MAEIINDRRVFSADEIEPREVEWLWYPYIPYGKVTIILGDPGEGKSTFALNLAAILSRGGPLPLSEGRSADKNEPMNVIYQNTEDDAEDTVVPRIMNAGGDRSRIFFIDEHDAALSFSDHVIGETIRKKNAKLFIFDPLTSYIGADISLNQANEVRSRMNYLIDVAKETGCTIVVVAHMNKMTGTKALYRASGSIDIIGSARSCLLIGTSPDDPANKVMAVQKSNLAEKGKERTPSVKRRRKFFRKCLVMERSLSRRSCSGWNSLASARGLLRMLRQNLGSSRANFPESGSGICLKGPAAKKNALPRYQCENVAFFPLATERSEYVKLCDHADREAKAERSHQDWQPSRATEEAVQEQS